MRTTFILAGMAAIAFACNNNSDKKNSADSSSHTEHHQENNGSKPDAHKNEVKETMTQMMHEMHNVKPTGNNEIDFAAMMVEHHKGAVKMSQVVIDKGTNAALKEFAQKLINDQNKEITFMQEFIAKSPKTPSSNSADFQKALNNSMMAMMKDTTPVYHNIDKDFAAQMIPHHQSAVDMAKAYLEFGEDGSLRTLCENIIASQTKEIAWLKDWLAANKN